MLKLDEPQIISLSPSPQYAKGLAQFQHQFVTLDSAGRVRPMTSAADELGLLLVLLNPPRDGEGAVCCYGGITDIVTGTPLAVGVEVIAYYGSSPNTQGCVIQKPTTGGKVYQVRGRVVQGAAALGDTAKIWLMNYVN